MRAMCFESLNEFIGRELEYAGSRCRVIEVLRTARGDYLVLQDQQQRDIQADRHGEAHRRVPRTHTIAVEVRGQPNPELEALWRNQS